MAGAIQSIFNGPQVPQMPAPPPPPPAPPDVNAIQQETEEQESLAKKRQGRAASILTGPQGDLTQTQTATKTLLGQ